MSWTYALALLTLAGDVYPIVVASRKPKWERGGYANRRYHGVSTDAQFPNGRPGLDIDAVAVAADRVPAKIVEAIESGAQDWSEEDMAVMFIGKHELDCLTEPTGAWDVEKIWETALDDESEWLLARYDASIARITAKYDAGLERQCRHIDFELEQVMHGFHNDFYAPLIRIWRDVENSVSQEFANWDIDHEAAVMFVAAEAPLMVGAAR